MGGQIDSTTVFNYRFANSLLRTPRVETSDSIYFSDIRWESPKDSIQGKKHFRTIDEDNLYYDFHLDSLSTALGLGCYWRYGNKAIFMQKLQEYAEITKSSSAISATIFVYNSVSLLHHHYLILLSISRFAHVLDVNQQILPPILSLLRHCDNRESRSYAY